MIRPMITVMTLLELNENLFRDMVLPSRPFTNRGYQDQYLTGWDMNKNVLINNILMETAELNVLYTDPDFMQWAIKQWSQKELPVWQAEYESLFFRYNPVWNKDGSIKHTASHTETPGVQDTETKTYNLLDTSDHSAINSGTLQTVLDKDTRDVTDRNEELDDTTTTKVSAFDSSSFENRDQTVIDRSTEVDETLTGEEDSTETVTDNRSTRNAGTDAKTGTETTVHSKLGSDLISDTYEDVETGNIGVTSSQELVQKERDLALFNIYDFIIESFKCRFCLLVY